MKYPDDTTRSEAPICALSYSESAVIQIITSTITSHALPFILTCPTGMASQWPPSALLDMIECLSKVRHVHVICSSAVIDVARLALAVHGLVECAGARKTWRKPCSVEGVTLGDLDAVATIQAGARCVVGIVKVWVSLMRVVIRRWVSRSPRARIYIPVDVGRVRIADVLMSWRQVARLEAGRLLDDVRAKHAPTAFGLGEDTVVCCVNR